MAQKENNIIMNKSVIKFNDFTKYREFVSILTSKKGLSRVMQFLIAASAAFIVIPFITESIRATENKDWPVFALLIVGAIFSTLAAILSFYSFIFINRRTILYRRVGLFLLCLFLGILLRGEIGKDIFITILIILLPIASLAGLFLPKILSKKEYERIADMEYQYSFDEMGADIKVILPGIEKENETKVKYEDIKMFFELDDVYYIFINPQQAMFIKKSGFAGEEEREKVLRMMARFEKRARLVNW